MQKTDLKLESFRLITAQEVAEHLKISENTVKVYRKTGKIPAKKIGGRFLYLEKDVIDFIVNAN